MGAVLLHAQNNRPQINNRNRVEFFESMFEWFDVKKKFMPDYKSRTA
jgi:hypothetical protein